MSEQVLTEVTERPPHAGKADRQVRSGEAGPTGNGASVSIDDPRLVEFGDDVAAADDAVGRARVRLAEIQDDYDCKVAEAAEAVEEAAGCVKVARAQLKEDPHPKPSDQIAAEERLESAERLHRRKERDLAALKRQSPDRAAREALDLAQRNRRQAQRQLEKARRELSRAETDASAGGKTQDADLMYGSVAEWFEEWLRKAYKRRINGRQRVWLAAWWENAEATSRLESLWRAWEALRVEPGTGMSVWWRDHADHHLQVLLDGDRGPFAAHPKKDTAENTNSVEDLRLPWKKPHPSMFPDVREQHHNKP